jgi:hypothetical protein
MASPVDAGRNATNVSTASTSWAVNVGSPAAGTLLIVFLRFAAAPGTITFTGYTPLVAGDTSDASDDTTAIYYRWADGTEGATDTCAPTNSVKGAAICWRITGAANPATQAPEVSSVAVGTTAANSANPNSVSGTGGSKDYLFLAMAAGDGESGAYTGAPTNYTNLQAANSGTGGLPATNCLMGGASRQLTAASDDPGAFTHAAHTTGWTAYTVVVHPAPPSSTSVGEVSLSPGIEPTSRSSHSLKVRARTTSGAGTLRAALYEGTTNRSGDLESTALTTTLTTYTLPIPNAKAVDITDYSNLGVRFWGYAAGGGSIVFEVDQIWLEVPQRTAVASLVTNPRPLAHLFAR